MKVFKIRIFVSALPIDVYWIAIENRPWNFGEI